MGFAGISAKRGLFAGVAVVVAVGLSGCFDMEQRVALRRDGSGTYAVVIAADGIIGQSLDEDDKDVDIGDNRAVTTVTHKGDKTVETSVVAFPDLSGLKLNDETVGLHVKSRGADGTSEVNFHRTFHVGSARDRHNKNGKDDEDEKMGKSILQSMFGDHTYKFAVWLPGTIRHIAPVRAGSTVVRPVVWADRTGHTIVWKMKLTDMMMAEQLDFDVDFAAKGDFKDAQSLPGEHRRHHSKRHHDDSDDGDDDDSGDD